MRRALIVGAGGQDGRLLTDLLLQRGYGVHGWTRTDALSAIACECVDLLAPAGVETALGNLEPDEIYYLAAFHHAAQDEIESSAAELERRSFDVHVTGLRNVLKALQAFLPRTRLFYAASSHVFGKAFAKSQSEQTPFAPHSAYGLSKAAGVECCRALRRAGVYAASGILFNHESSLRKSSFLSQKVVQGVLRARRDPAFRLVLGDLDARVDWGYAPDYVDAMHRILQLPRPDDFVIATGTTHTVREFVETAFAAADLDWCQHVATDRTLLRKANHPLCGDAGKLRAATGWSPRVSFSEMVRTLVVEALKAHRGARKLRATGKAGVGSQAVLATR